jgi:hypothetical protein
MIKNLVCLLAAATALNAPTLGAQGTATKASEGTLNLEKKTYPLRHAFAYETTIDDEEAIAVVLSGQTVSGEKLKEVRDAEKGGGDGDFNRPFLKLVFKKTGELNHWCAAAGGTMLGRRRGEATGEIKREDGRVSGKASQPMETEGMFPSGFDARFDVALVKAGESLPASASKRYGPAANVKPSVTGTFKGNGKEAKLAYVSARWREPFDDKPSMMLVFTEKDHSKDNKPDFNASFGKFGSALIISLHEDGSIFGCEVAHSAHKKQGFSSIGNIETTDFSYEDGKVAGELTTHGQVETFGETWEVNLKFVAPLGEIPKEFQVAEPKKEDQPAQPNDTSASVEAGDEPAAHPAAELKARDLALTKDATDVEYQAMMEHVLFKSKADVKSVCAELAANLKAQGWEKEGIDLVQPKSSILKRKHGAASLTIFVKPENGGSAVNMFTEGLAWDEP